MCFQTLGFGVSIKTMKNKNHMFHGDMCYNGIDHIVPQTIMFCFLGEQYLFLWE
jgi:hypothetical protein